MRRIRILHTTRYSYAQPVTLLEHTLHLRPREGHDIRIESSRLRINPDYEIKWQRDVFGNSVAKVAFAEPTDNLAFTSELVVQHYEERPLDFVVAEHATKFPFRYDPIEQIELMPYQLSVYPKNFAAIGAWMERIWRPGEILETAELLGRINQRIVESIAYVVRTNPGVQPPALTLERKRGSCRDMATLFIEACRYCGLASRFVSGYLVSSAAVKDYSSTHAWSEIYLPGSGWRGFDSTSGSLVSGDHIAVAVHRDPEAVPPVSGSFVGHASLKPKMDVDVQVAAL